MPLAGAQPSGATFTAAALSTFPLCRNLREVLYKAYITRASSGRTDNQPVIEQILALRREQAMLLNYTSYTDYALADRVSTPSPDRQPSCVLWMSCRVSFPHHFHLVTQLYVSLPDTPQVWCMCRARIHCLSLNRTQL